MSVSTTTQSNSQLNSSTGEAHSMFSSKVQNQASVESFIKTKIPDNRVGRQTRLSRKFNIVATSYGDIVNLKVDSSGNVTCSRKEITLKYIPFSSEKSYSHDFKIKPYAKKHELYDQAADFLIHIFKEYININLAEKLRIPEDYLNAIKEAIKTQGTSNNFKSTVLAVEGCSALERYVGSRLLRFCDRIISALLTVAENYWTYVERETRKSGGILAGKVTNKSGKSAKSELDKTIDRYIKDASREEYREGVVNNKNLNVKTKAVRQFVSLFYITPAEILETKIWYVKRLSGQQIEPSKEVDIDLARILDYWMIFNTINKVYEESDSEIYFPEVPFYVLDAVGIWDISKSEKKPTFKPVSLSSITGLRMPFLMGYNWQGNAIDGTDLGYVMTSVRIDKLITHAKVAGMNALEDAMIKIARDLFHFNNYSLPSLKHAHYSRDKSIREYEDEMDGNIPNEPLGPSLQYTQKFPSLTATNKVAQKFRETGEGAQYYDAAMKQYQGQLGHGPTQPNF